MQDSEQGAIERPLRGPSFAAILTIEAGLCQLQVVIAEIRPEEPLDLGARCRVLATRQFVGCIQRGARQAREEPAIGHQQVLRSRTVQELSLIHISEPTRLGMISYAVF